MRFDPSTGELKTDGNWLIKKLHCPLQKRWDEMTPIAGSARERLCTGCGKNVHDIDGLDEDAVIKVVRDNQNACLSLRMDSTTLTIEGHSAPQTLVALDESCPLQRIRTARGAREVNELASPTLRPLVVEVPKSAGNRMIIWQNGLTGRIAFSYSMRFNPDEINADCETREHWRKIAYQHQEEARRCGDDGLPIAAYMIPSDLRVGERVWIEDVIEAVVAVHGPGYTENHNSAVAIWLGESFQFVVDEPDRVIG